MRLLMMVLAASLAFGQTRQVLPLKHHENEQDLQEIAIAVRSLTEMQQMSVDAGKRALTLEGTPGQIALAEWLVRQFDVPGDGTFSGVHEYRTPAASDDVVRVFYVDHAENTQHLQEVVTTIRSVGDIRKVFVCNACKVVAVRGDHQQIGLAAWIVDQLNQPAKTPAPAPHEYKLGGDDIAQLVELSNPETPDQLQEIVTLIRSIADLSRLFVCHARRAVVMRGTSERIALAVWLAGELDKPVNGPAPPANQPHEYRMPQDPDNIVRIYFLGGSPDELQKRASQIRANARIGRLFTYRPLGALAVRGTAGQVATAERALEEMKAQ